MTTTEKLRNTPVQEGRKQNTLRNTLKCVLVLGVIAVVCVALLAVANRFLQPEVTLDRATSDMINEIAPTGADDAAAFSSYIKMVDLGKSKYAVTDLDAYNKKYGSVNQKIRALYTSTHKDTGVVTFVVEAENKGRDAAIVVLTAYDADNKVSGIKIKSQAESYWARLANRKDVFDKFIGTSGTLTSGQIATGTGATLSLGGIVGAVNLANDFVVRLGGATQPPAPETNAEKLEKLYKVSSATAFTRYTAGGTVPYVFIGDNGDYIVEAKSGLSLDYSGVTLLVRIVDSKVAAVTVSDNNFAPTDFAASDRLLDFGALNNFFVNKSLADLNGTSANDLAGSTGATNSARGIVDAVKNALAYQFTEEAA